MSHGAENGACRVGCGHPPADHDENGECMHLCDCAWPQTAEKDVLLAAADAIEAEAEQYDGISLTAACEAAGMRRAAWMVRERASILPPAQADEHTPGCRDWMDAAPGQRRCVCHVSKDVPDDY